MENTNFKLGIKRVPYSRMLKSEIADFVERTIAIVENYDLELALIGPMYALLRDKEADIKLLRLSYGIDVERLRVNKLKSEMMLIISAFKLKVRLLSKSNPELDMHIIQNAINMHLRYLDKSRNDKELSQKIAGFFDQLSINADLQTILSDFELTPEVDAMKAAFKTVDEAWKKRVRLLSLRPNVSTKEIVKGMAQAVDNLFKGIEVANMLHVLGDIPEEGEQVDLGPVMDELNQLSEMYALSVSIREANNKRKAEQEKEGEDGIDEDGGEEDEGGEDAAEPMTTAMCFGNDGSAYEGIITPIDEDDAEEVEVVE